MNIRFVSSLTAEDEIRLAEGLLTVLASLLDQFPIAYTLKIEAGGSRVFQHHHSPADPPLVRLHEHAGAQPLQT
jgi:hypothetical protein